MANIITAPERVVDMISGKAAEEDYDPKWDNLLYAENDPLETKTWWGGLIRTGTEVATTVGLTGGFGTLNKAGTGLTFAKNFAGSFTSNAAIASVRFDLLDKDSQDDNISGMLKERYPWLDTP